MDFPNGRHRLFVCFYPDGTVPVGCQFYNLPFSVLCCAAMRLFISRRVVFSANLCSCIAFQNRTRILLEIRAE